VPDAVAGSVGLVVNAVAKKKAQPEAAEAHKGPHPPLQSAFNDSAPVQRSLFPSSEGMGARGVLGVDEEIIVRGTTGAGSSKHLTPSPSQGEEDFRGGDLPHTQRLSRSGHPHRVPLRPGKAGKTWTPKMRLPKENSLDSRGLEMELDVLMPSRRLVPGGAPSRKAAGRAPPVVRKTPAQHAKEERHNISLILGHGTFKDVLDEEEAQQTLRSKTKAGSYSPRAMRARVALQRKKRVRDAVDMWWYTALQDAGRHPDDGLMRKDFVEIHRRIQKLLMPQTNDLESEELALVEWQHASQGQETIGHKLFSSSMFDLADLWCPDCSEHSYVAFLEYALEGTAACPPWPPERWLPLVHIAPIQRNDGFLQAEFEALCAANGDLTSQTWNLFDNSEGFNKLVRKIASVVSQSVVDAVDAPVATASELSTVARPTPENSQKRASGPFDGDLDAIFDESAWRDKMKQDILSRRLKRVLTSPDGANEHENDLSEASRIELRNYIDRAGDRNIRDLGSGIKASSDSPETSRLKWQVAHQAQVAYLCIQALLHSKSEDSTQLLAHLKTILSDDSNSSLFAGQSLTGSGDDLPSYDSSRLGSSDSEGALSMHRESSRGTPFRDFLGPGDALTKASEDYDRSAKVGGQSPPHAELEQDAMPTSLYKLFWVELMERRERKWAHFGRT
jgi:hypothetical protein